MMDAQKQIKLLTDITWM